MNCDCCGSKLDYRGERKMTSEEYKECVEPIEKEKCNFGVAIALLKMGYKVARQGWNGKGMWLKLQVPDAHSKMSLPYIYMFTADGHQVPWLASQTDILAEDYVGVE